MYIITDVILGDIRNAKHYPPISNLVLQILNFYIVKNELKPPGIIHAEIEHVENDFWRRITPTRAYAQAQEVCLPSLPYEVEGIQAEFEVDLGCRKETVGITKKAREILNTKE